MLNVRINPWIAPNLGAPPPQHPRGAWLNYRKLASSGYVPNRFQRAKLLGSQPYAIVIPWALDSQQTLEFQGVAPGYFAMLEAVGDSLEAEGYDLHFHWSGRHKLGLNTLADFLAGELRRQSLDLVELLGPEATPYTINP